MGYLSEQRVDVVIVLQTTTLFAGRNQIAVSALAKRLPTIFGYSAHVAVGGLVSYGVDLMQCFYRTAYFVDKILRGTRPGDLPVEFPNKMQLAVNLKTANALGITVPPLMLIRADDVNNEAALSPLTAQLLHCMSPLLCRMTVFAAKSDMTITLLLYPNDGATYLRGMPDSDEEDSPDTYDHFHRHG